jgi:hypothetical protein
MKLPALTAHSWWRGGLPAGLDATEVHVLILAGVTVFVGIVGVLDARRRACQVGGGWYVYYRLTSTERQQHKHPSN